MPLKIIKEIWGLLLSQAAPLHCTRKALSGLNCCVQGLYAIQVEVQPCEQNPEAPSQSPLCPCIFSLPPALLPI